MASLPTKQVADLVHEAARILWRRRRHIRPGDTAGRSSGGAGAEIRQANRSLCVGHRSDLRQVEGRVGHVVDRSKEHTSELQSLMRISYAVFCLKKKKQNADSSIQTKTQSGR